MFWKKKSKPEEAVLACPRCEQPLATHGVTTDVEAWEIEVDVCSAGCGGVWLDGHDFEIDSRVNLLADIELGVLNIPSASKPHEDMEVQCPACQVPMHRYNWNNSAVELDQCRRCKGRWFDGSEIRAIQTLLRR